VNETIFLATGVALSLVGIYKTKRKYFLALARSRRGEVCSGRFAQQSKSLKDASVCAC